MFMLMLYLCLQLFAVRLTISLVPVLVLRCRDARLIYRLGSRSAREATRRHLRRQLLLLRPRRHLPHGRINATVATTRTFSTTTSIVTWSQYIMRSFALKSHRVI